MNIQEQDTTKELPRMVSLRKLSELYGIPLYTLRTWATYRYFPCLKLGKKIYVKIGEFEEWLDKNTENYSFFGMWRFKDTKVDDSNVLEQLDYKALLKLTVS